MIRFESKGSTCIVLLANGYMEMYCINPWLPPVQQKWHVLRVVDYHAVTMQ